MEEAQAHLIKSTFTLKQLRQMVAALGELEYKLQTTPAGSSVRRERKHITTQLYHLIGYAYTLKLRK